MVPSFFRRHSKSGRKASDGKLADLVIKSTEGWIAGILILYQAAKNTGLDTESFESGKQVREEALFRYLSMEVLKTVGECTQNALVRLALLEDFFESEATEILEIGKIRSLLGQCLDFDMFIQRIPGHPVVYRFHSLFREFLLNHLKDRIPYEQLVGIHLKAPSII